MSATAQSPYKFVVTLAGDDSAPEVQGVAIPPRQTITIQPEPVEQPSPDLDVAPEAAPPVVIRPGMKCWLGNHQVRVEAIKQDGIGRIHLTRDVTMKGPAWLDDLKPIACTVEVDDHVMLSDGEGLPLFAKVVQVGEGDTALFFIPFYRESHWLHSSHVVSIRPRSARR